MSVVEQQYQAVLAVLNGVPVSEAASRLQAHRHTVHRWLARYEQALTHSLSRRTLSL
jgi:transposase